MAKPSKEERIMEILKAHDFVSMDDMMAVLETIVTVAKETKQTGDITAQELRKQLDKAVKDLQSDSERKWKEVIKYASKLRDGKTPSKGELLNLITPLIPVVKDGYVPIKGKDYFTDSDIDLVALDVMSRLPQPSEVTPEAYRDALESLEGDEMLSAKFIKDLPDFDGFKREVQTVVSGRGTAGGGNIEVYQDNTKKVSSQRIKFYGATVTTDADGAALVTVTGGGGTGGTGKSYLYTQGSASATWVVTHSLDDENPVVEVFSPDDLIVEPESITIDSANQLTITFGAAVSGKARILGTGPVSGITGLIEEGTNVTITGSGTTVDPYVISSTGGGGSSLPSQTGNAGKFLTTDGSTASWQSVGYNIDGGTATSTYGGILAIDGGTA